MLFFFLPTFSWKFQISQKLSIRFSRNFAQSFYIHPKGPLRVQRHQNRMAGMWETAKISPKMAKKQSFFDFFFDFLKNCPYDSNEIFYSLSTPYYGPLCAISLISYGWDVRNIAKFSPKMAKKSHFSIFSIFSQTVHTIRTKASQKEKDLSRLLYRICGSGLIFHHRLTLHFFDDMRQNGWKISVSPWRASSVQF